MLARPLAAVRTDQAAATVVGGVGIEADGDRHHGGALWGLMVDGRVGDRRHDGVMIGAVRSSELTTKIPSSFYTCALTFHTYSVDFGFRH